MTEAIAAFVDVERYPILDASDLDRVVPPLRAAFARTGVASLPGFVHPAGVERMVLEAEQVTGAGHHAEVRSTVHLSESASPGASESGGPDERPLRSALRVVAADLIPEEHALRQLYESTTLRELVRRILDVDRIHPYADPLGSLNVAEMDCGDELGWHFDQTDFVTSLSIRSAGGGGDFEVAPGLRPGGVVEAGALCSVLDGGSSEVRRLPFEPGTLLVFAGRRSLHRVTPVGAGPSRLVGLLAFDTRPGTDSSARLKSIRYGRTTTLPRSPRPCRVGDGTGA